eukprot:15725-Heterococcus_DN1.PRE.2
MVVNVVLNFVENTHDTVTPAYEISEQRDVMMLNAVIPAQHCMGIQQHNSSITNAHMTKVRVAVNTSNQRLLLVQLILLAY